MFNAEWDNATLTHWYEFLNVQWGLEQLDKRPYYEDEIETYDEDGTDL